MNDIEKAIDDLKGLKAICLDDEYEKPSIAAIKLARTYTIVVTALEHQLTNGWIPVSKRLPATRQHEHGEPIEFNIMLRGGTVATTGCINDSDIWGWMDWCNFKFNPIGVDVIAWQPLPEPYSEV